MNEFKEDERQPVTPSRTFSEKRKNSLSVGSLLYKPKVKVAENIFNSLKLNQNIASSLRSDSIQKIGSKIKFKMNPLQGSQYTPVSMKFKEINRYGLENSTYKVNNDKPKILINPKESNLVNNQLPFIESKLFKSLSKSKILSSGSNNIKHSSNNSIVKSSQGSKISTTALSSTARVTSNTKSLHRRSESTNFFK